MALTKREKALFRRNKIAYQDIGGLDLKKKIISKKPKIDRR